MKLYDDFDNQIKDVKIVTDKIEEDIEASARKLKLFEDAMRKEIDDKIKEELKIERRRA